MDGRRYTLRKNEHVEVPYSFLPSHLTPHICDQWMQFLPSFRRLTDGERNDEMSLPCLLKPVGRLFNRTCKVDLRRLHKHVEESCIWHNPLKVDAPPDIAEVTLQDLYYYTDAHDESQPQPEFALQPEATPTDDEFQLTHKPKGNKKNSHPVMADEPTEPSPEIDPNIWKRRRRFEY